MAQRRRRRRVSGATLALLSLVVVAGGSWWFFFAEFRSDSAESGVSLSAKPALSTDRPEVLPANGPDPDVMEKGQNDPPRPSTPPIRLDRERIESLVATGEQALARNDLITARTHFNDAFSLGPFEPLKTRLVAELTRLGQETVFSPRFYENDPLMERYIVQPGETLGKIATAFKVSDELLAAMNGIQNRHIIRVGQTLKVAKGPFYATVDKSNFGLDVFLGNVLVKHYRVGLGADDSTPDGEWRVSTKLINPTYYPPRGGQIVPADDPHNPLGERWIGLVGVSGSAVGQLRYGIHGTIEPESIGRNSSLGCIRMFNEDVEVLYSCLVEKHSTVTVK